MIALKINSKKEKSKIILPKMIYTTPMSKIKKITINNTFMNKISILSLKKNNFNTAFYIFKNSKFSCKINTKSIGIISFNLTNSRNNQVTFGY